MVEVLLLGAAQDAGIPQSGCGCRNCEAAWADPTNAEDPACLAIIIEGAGRSLFYCPDIDGWEAWDHSLTSLAAETDIMLLDGTFFSAAELPGRNLDEIPHPFVTDTCTQLTGLRVSITFIHLNHSNPLLREGAELDWLLTQGHVVGRTGSTWRLA